MAGSDRDASMGPMMTHGKLNRRHRTHADVQDATTTRQQAGNDRLFHHLSGGSRITPDYDCARAGVGA